MSKKQQSLKELRLKNQVKMINLLVAINNNATDEALKTLEELDATMLNRDYNSLNTKESMCALEFAAQNGNIKVLEKILQKPGIEFNKAVHYAIKGNHFDALLMLKLYGAPINPKKDAKAANPDTPALKEDELLSTLTSLNQIDLALNTFEKNKKISLAYKEVLAILNLSNISGGINYIKEKLNLLKQSDKTSKLDVNAIIQQLQKSTDFNSQEKLDITWEENVFTTVASEEVKTMGTLKSSNIFNEVD